MEEKAKFRRPFLYKIINAYVSVLHRLYYRKFTVAGLEKVPANTPVIFAPNHQNALMDALAVLFAARRPVVFMARADIFKKPAIAKILNLFKILPIYRIRDGYGELSRNQEVFDNTVDVLRKGMPICILPEGNHDGKKRLRQLKKGISRISFQAEQSAGNNLNLHIVPVGLDYSNYFEAGADLLVVFGTPIKVSDYLASYQENESRTINELMNALVSGMRSVMIHIPETHYELTYRISEIYEPNVWNTCNVKRHPYNKLTIKQYIIQKITEAFSDAPEKADLLSDALKSYDAVLKKHKLNDCQIQQKGPSFLRLASEILVSLLLLPVHLYGAVFSFIPFTLPGMISGKIQDPHFKSSIQFGIGIILFPLYYIIVFLLAGFFTEHLWQQILFGISLPVTGYFSFYMAKYLKMLQAKIRIFLLKTMHTNQYNSLISERKILIEHIKNTINS